MPWGDWQFWVVTLAAVGGLWALARALMPRKRPKRTALTISATSRGDRSPDA
tara:strand:- start:851 stop:1006 length:156 start_codon:yes stop_codon:yes gene_type:complete